MQFGEKIIKSTQTPVAQAIPPELFERLLERYEHGHLPKVQRCYYTVLHPRFGKPYAIPDFVLNVNVPMDWINNGTNSRVLFGRQQARLFTGQALAPMRGGKIRWWIENHFLHSVEFCDGYVSWMQQELELPWTVLGEMPEFGYGFSLESALEKFL